MFSCIFLKIYPHIGVPPAITCFGPGQYTEMYQLFLKDIRIKECTPLVCMFFGYDGNVRQSAKCLNRADIG